MRNPQEEQIAEEQENKQTDHKHEGLLAESYRYLNYDREYISQNHSLFSIALSLREIVKLLRKK